MALHSHQKLRPVPVAAFVLLCVLAASAAYGSTREWRFNVTLDDKPIGTHRFLLRDSGQRRELTSEAKFNVRILFFDAYRYEHSARELWDGDCLQRIDARTADNGKQSTVTGELEAGSFRVIRENSIDAIGACVQTFAYWNPLILEADRLLNPQTGEYVPVNVVPIGRESIAGYEHADRYRLVGKDASATELQIELWYSPAGEWLALESRTPDGRRLRYSLE